MPLPQPAPEFTAGDITRFWSHVPNRPADGCWLWAGGHFAPRSPGQAPYGRFNVLDRATKRIRGMKASRAAWVITHGDPYPLLVLHKCDTPACVRPDHLFLGDWAANARDRDAKGRGADRRGARSGTARLTAEQVAEIRARAAKGEEQQPLADEYGITQSNVSMIVNYRTWR